MTAPTIVLICGARDFADRAFFDLAMERWIAKHGVPALVIEGCARGADSLAEAWATDRGVRIAHYPADWTPKPGGPTRQGAYGAYNPAAGPERNQLMLNAGPHAVIAFSRGLAKSRGTADMVRRSREAGVPVWLPVAGSDNAR